VELVSSRRTQAHEDLISTATSELPTGLEWVRSNNSVEVGGVLVKYVKMKFDLKL